MGFEESLFRPASDSLLHVRTILTGNLFTGFHRNSGLHFLCLLDRRHVGVGVTHFVHTFRTPTLLAFGFHRSITQRSLRPQEWHHLQVPQ